VDENPRHTGESDIAALAKRQHGYVTRRQLLRLGLGQRAIDYRLKLGRLIRVHGGVYAVGHLPALPMDRAYGALLACGAGAVLSHGSAAAVWGLEKHFKAPFEVTAPSRHRRPGITVHYAALHRADRAVNRGLPVTSPARTALDLAPRLTARQLDRAVDDLRSAGYLQPDPLAEVLARYPHHRGAAKLRSVDTGREPTRSDWELDFIEFLKRYDLPMPLINTKISRYVVDVLFPDEKVIVELDSWQFHSSRSSFRRDRQRDAELLALGYVTVRITWERLADEPDQVVAELRTILASRFLRSAG
jgi:very-short-patch-repair endonuclease